MDKKVNWFLYSAVLAANIGTLTSGIDYGWTSPVLPKLNNENNLEDNPFGRAITPFEGSWISSLISLGATFGPFLGVAIVDKIGRKKTLLLTALPLTISHVVLAFATDINLFYFSRFVLGLAIGCIYSVVPIYVGEVAEDSNRGSLGCLLSLTCTVGTLFCYMVGPYLRIRDFCLIIVAPIVAFAVIFGCFIPESPYYLLMVGREEEARRSLKKLRRKYVEKELEEMRRNVEMSAEQTTDWKALLKVKALRRGLVVGVGLMFFQQFSGITVIVSYMQTIFQASGANIAPEISSIIVGCIQLMTNASTSQLVDRLGRRVLLLSSLVGGFLSHSLLGCYFYLKTNNHSDVVSYLSWLPVCSVIFYIVTFMSGLGPVSWAMIGELFPTHLRSYSSTICCFVSLLFGFLLTLFFPNLTEIIGMAFCFWIFAGSCVVGLFFVWKMVPETKGKSLREVQMMLEKGSK